MMDNMDKEYPIAELQRAISEIQMKIGKIEGYSQIWLPERDEMLKAREKIYARLGVLEGLSATIHEINNEVQKMKAMRNQIIGASIVLSFLSAFGGQLLLKWLQ